MRLITWLARGRALLLAAALAAAGLSAAGCDKKVALPTDVPTTAEGGIESVAHVAAAAEPPPGTLIDNRDGQTYKTVKTGWYNTGNQTWMAENLNFRTRSGSWCYENSADSCKKYGRLYDWETAMTVCPKGWHLPSEHDWNLLVVVACLNRIGQSNGEWAEDEFKELLASMGGKMLKAKSGWNEYDGNSGDGTDDYGFTALPSGGRNIDGGFGDAGYYGYWWTAIEYDSEAAYSFRMDYYNDYPLHGGHHNKSIGLSVRCVAD